MRPLELLILVSLGSSLLGCAAEASAASRSGAAQRNERGFSPGLPMSPRQILISLHHD